MIISSEYPFTSRSAIYGDGCFTTAAIHQGQIELLAEHILRLKSGCQQLRIKVEPYHWDSLKAEVQNTVKPLNHGMIKILISAGEGGRGYARVPDSQPHAYTQVLRTPPDYERWRKEGITLKVADLLLAKQPALTGVKHLNRLEQSLLKTEENVEDDLLVLDCDNMIVECSAANLFWRACGSWFTPDLRYSGVGGVMRNHILAQCASNNMQVSKVRARLPVLNSATDMFICNSLMKLVRVNNLRLQDGSVLTFNNNYIDQIRSLLSKTINV